MTHRIFWIIALSLLSGTLARHEDCEVPPTVNFATVRIEDEEDGVRAIYACHSGYILEGETEILCDLNTDEWNNDPPKCLRIESQDADDNEEDNVIDGPNSETATQQNKKKNQNIQEDPYVTAEYATNLDMTCVSARVKAPEIHNGFVQKYDRRRKGESIFIVAFYSCNDNFELEDTERNAVYCSKKKWIGQLPNCIALSDYEEEEYDSYDDGGEEEDEEEPAKPPVIEQSRTTETSTEVQHTVKVSEEVPDVVSPTAESVTDVNVIVQSTTDAYSPRVLDQSCGPDKGGCDHNCEMVLYPGENEPRIVCTCYTGFTLDPYDYRRCHDIDECDINNGGCEQICNNVPGSHECTCQEGLQINTLTGNTCVDVNECLLRNGHGPCQDTCHNTWGSYTCTCDGLPGTKLNADKISCEDDGECAISNGGCSHICLATLGRVFCLCPSGFLLSKDWKNCQDINECETPEIASRCPGGCENTPGSYVCHPTPTEETRSNEVESESESVTEPKPVYPQHTLECEEGFRLNSDGNCVDIDECAEGIARCENCRNTHGSYDCTCPSGYELSEDETSCVDINECEAYSNQEQEEGSPTPYRLCSHTCENTLGSFICKCGENFHLDADRRTCLQDTCEDLNNPELNKTRCSYYCEDGADGPICKCPEQYELAQDKYTCVPGTADACQELGGKERCFPGSCVNAEGATYTCRCPAGFKDEVYFCKDIDECAEGTHNCSHICFNTEGSFECSCPIGLREVPGDSSRCEDIDECAERADACGDKVCRNTEGGFTCVCPDDREPDSSGECASHNLCSYNNGGCSHECSSPDDRVQCMCPPEMNLSDDGFTCIHQDACANNNNGCSQICNSQLQGSCSCETGYELQKDGKTCNDYDECIENNGGCEHICVNKPGGYECLCRWGYMLLNGSCLDIDECALDSHNCAAGLLCQNLNGSYACQCPQGFAFVGDSSTECSDVDECSDNNGNCSDICINLRGSFQCSCPPGQVLTDDEKTCDYVDGCLIDNGGCSHSCVFAKPLTTCACPYGYALGGDAKTCVDVNECSMGTTKCSHLCVNNVGSFECACPEGYALAENRRDCFDMDECIDNNGNCSNICINLLGSFSCACEAGFELKEDLRTCTDVDECEQSLHDCSHYCANVVGGYECSCPAGFVLGPNKLTCSDVDECSGYSSCSHICRNTLGSFDCECPSGMVLDGDRKTCVDGDFCNRLRPQCSHYCENVDGGFHCGCPLGLTLGADSLTCVDVNECVINNGGCSHTCTNVEGSYSCLCPAGSKLAEDGKSCQDVNECDVDNGRCAHYCINTRGGHACECSDGYALQDDGFNCVESDPCRRNNGGCQQLCVAAGAGVKCACRPGFILNPLDNSSCADIDECQTENICPQQACRNTPGSYECTCQEGFSKNLYGQCVDVNECEYQNGGCPGECVNLPGSFECKCPPGLRLSVDRKSCVEVRDQCQPFRPPKYGEIHCTRSRHKTQLYYKTRCSVWCVAGYKLEGPAIRHCSASGQWDNYENRCIPQLCPRLPRAEHGTILPANCLLGKTYVGERCLLHCNSGYVPAGRKAIVCNADQTWSHNSTFDCIPVGATTTYTQQHQSSSASGNRRRLEIGTRMDGVAPRIDSFAPRLDAGVRAYIKCPRNTTVLLPLGHKTAHIILQKPKTNLDYRYVESFPAWTRNLQAHLGAGVHVVTFRGREPNTRRGAACRTVITVKSTIPPRVAFCPPSFEISLATNQERRSIVWKEPQFQSESQIKNIHKSNIPGQLFSEGVHRISYEAVDVDGLTARCEFNIVVKGPPLQSLPYSYNYPQVEERSAKLLANHDSYIICNGQAPVKLFGNQPINLPPGCFIKNIRINPVRQYLRRRLITHRWTPFRSF